MGLLATAAASHAAGESDPEALPAGGNARVSANDELLELCPVVELPVCYRVDCRYWLRSDSAPRESREDAQTAPAYYCSHPMRAVS